MVLEVVILVKAVCSGGVRAAAEGGCSRLECGSAERRDKMSHGEHCTANCVCNDDINRHRKASAQRVYSGPSAAVTATKVRNKC